MDRLITIMGIFLQIIGAYATFQFIESGNDFTTSRQLCIGRGMKLASVPKSNQQYDDVKKFLSSQYNYYNTWVWIGLYWDAAVGSFFWSDKNSVVNNSKDLQWWRAGGEPDCMTDHTGICDDSKTHDCVVITYYHGLITRPCSDFYSALCEKASMSTKASLRANSTTTKDTTSIGLADVTTALTTSSTKMSHATTAMTTISTKVVKATTALMTRTEDVGNAKLYMTISTTKVEEATSSLKTTALVVNHETAALTTIKSNVDQTTSVVPLINNENTCLCTCDSVGTIWMEIQSMNLTSDEIRTFVLKRIEKITSDIAVDKTKTSSFTRRHTSARDDRESSARIGLVGIIVLVIPVLFIVGIDCISFYQRRKR